MARASGSAIPWPRGHHRTRPHTPRPRGRSRNCMRTKAGDDRSHAPTCSSPQACTRAPDDRSVQARSPAANGPSRSCKHQTGHAAVDAGVAVPGVTRQPAVARRTTPFDIRRWSEPAIASATGRSCRYWRGAAERMIAFSQRPAVGGGSERSTLSLAVVFRGVGWSGSSSGALRVSQHQAWAYSGWTNASSNSTGESRRGSGDRAGSRPVRSARAAHRAGKLLRRGANG